MKPHIHRVWQPRTGRFFWAVANASEARSVFYDQSTRTVWKAAHRWCFRQNLNQTESAPSDPEPR